MKLSEHFSLSEFERSATATKLGIDNSVPSQYIPALQQLCKEILEPLRAFTGQPIIISSGYRCPQLNIKVGGVYSSQHTLGEACDIRIPEYDFTGEQGQRFTNTDILDRWFTWIMNNCDYDHYQNLNLIKSRVCGKYSTDCVSREVLIIMFDNNICSHEQRPA